MVFNKNLGQVPIFRFIHTVNNVQNGEFQVKLNRDITSKWWPITSACLVARTDF